MNHLKYAHSNFAVLLIIFAIFLLFTVKTLEPIRIFTTYYLCRVIDTMPIYDQDCDSLPTVRIAQPKTTDALQLGAYDPEELRLFFQNHTIEKHIYAHRTNSPERARLYRKYYHSFEFDAIWDEGKKVVDIFHWPERKSIDFHLSELISIIPNDRFYWMDIKNLSESNVSEFSEYMSRVLVASERLDKSHMIIESKNPIALSFLSSRNFTTSYYLPAIDYEDNCEHHKRITQTILKNISLYPSSYISFPYNQQTYVDHCLLPVIGDIKQLSWGGLPFAIPKGASDRYHAYIVDHALTSSEL